MIRRLRWLHLFVAIVWRDFHGARVSWADAKLIATMVWGRP